MAVEMSNRAVFIGQVSCQYDLCTRYLFKSLKEFNGIPGMF